MAEQVIEKQAATPEGGQASGKQQVGFGKRFAAALIDGVIFMVVGMIIPVSIRFFFNAVAGALYSILLWVNWNGQTLGKKLMKIKVVKEDGTALTYSDAVVRYLGYIVSTVVLFIGYLWIIWDEKKQGWHDKIAKTLVVKE